MTAGPQQYYSPANFGPGYAAAGGQPSLPRRKRLVVAAVLAALAAALSVTSMFVDYNSYVAIAHGEVDFAQRSGPWGASYVLAEGRDAPHGTVPLYGIALVLLVAALLVGLVLAVLASSRRVADARLRAARVAAIVYGTAAVTIELMLTINLLAFLSHEEPVEPGQDWVYQYSLELGYWLLLGMALLAATALVLTVLPESDARPTQLDARSGPARQYPQPQAAQQYPYYDPYYGHPGYGTQHWQQPGAGPWAAR